MPIDFTADLHLLVWTVALCVVQMIVAVAGATVQVGLPRLAGNREPLPELTGWAGRAQRAHRNMLETLVLFAALVIVAHMAGLNNDSTVLGAQIFFWARLAYAIVYLIGIPWVRTSLWALSMVGLVIIFLQLV
ncbi:MAG TPA: MAPEG family protein [Dongiaceae bacterium]|jgi:uncharacterized MAPEG superfamily protein